MLPDKMRPRSPAAQRGVEGLADPQVVRVAPVKAEAEDVRLGGVQHLESEGLRRETVVECLRQPAEVIVEAPDPIRPESLQGNPELHHVGAARTLEAARPEIGARLAGPTVEEVRRLLCEGRGEVACVTHEDHPRGEGEEHHLVRVPRHRAREVDPADPRPMRRGEERARAVRAVHVQPESPRGTECPNRLEVVERPRRRLAGGGDHREHGAA